MAILLQIKGACKGYGEQILLDSADASISDNVKVGFIGRNGAGKSTLLRILLGEEDLDNGEIIRHPALRLGYLRQHDPFVPGESAIEFLQRDSGQPSWKCGEVAGQFEIKGTYLDGPVNKLSGGWQTRVKLSALLLSEPNLLLLDEPTNFLDLRTQILLEHFLVNYKAACLIVSHDRAFLGSTCDHILDLSAGKLTAFPGKVESYLTFLEEKQLHEQRSNQAVLVKMKHLEEFIAKNKARASTATLAKSKEKQLERLELTKIENAQPVPRIRAPRVAARKGPALRCKNLVIGYPERSIASDVNIEIEHGSRIAIVGDNGQGKTTFLRTLVDSLKPIEGEVRWGHGCQIGIYAQHVYTSLSEKQTVMEYLYQHAARGKKDQEIQEVAGSFLFRGSHSKKPISVLSGGERARLCLAGLMLSDINILILDEPGNHLDVDTVESLADALTAYSGTVIFTSHDRHFTRKIATGIVEVRDGRVISYNGQYESYVYKVNKEIEAGERELATQLAKTPDAVAKTVKSAIVAAPKSDLDPKKEIKLVEKNIAQLDAQKRSLNARLPKITDIEELDQVENELSIISIKLTAAEDLWSEFNDLIQD